MNIIKGKIKRYFNVTRLYVQFLGHVDGLVLEGIQHNRVIFHNPLNLLKENDLILHFFLVLREWKFNSFKTKQLNKLEFQFIFFISHDRVIPSISNDRGLQLCVLFLHLLHIEIIRNRVEPWNLIGTVFFAHIETDLRVLILHILEDLSHYLHILMELLILRESKLLFKYFDLLFIES